MRATEIKPGDKYIPSPSWQNAAGYTVEKVRTILETGYVECQVRFLDGGNGIRTFTPETNVPLVRGE